MSSRRTIGNTLTINTIEDAVSVLAQYAPNDNPTSSQIHSTWMTGDLYMRTKSTAAGATWSDWHRIIGESGDETLYYFNIAVEKTSNSVYDPPATCYYNTWQDSPVTTNTTYPYLWMKVIKRVWNDATQAYVESTAKYTRITGEESTDYFIEGALNTIKMSAGENSKAVNCTYTFYKKSAVSSTRSTAFSYYAVYLRSGTTFSLLTMNTGYDNWGTGTSVTVNASVPYSSGNTVYDAVVIYTFTTDYHYTSPESQTYIAKKEIPIVRDGENSFVVDLDNEMKNIALTDDGKTFSAVDLYFKVGAYYGTTNVLSDQACTVSASCSDSHVTLTTTDAKTTGIHVQIAQNVPMSDSTDISVTVSHTSYGSRTVMFTLAGVRGGENAVLQELLPSLDSINFARQSGGTLTPSERSITLFIKKTQGNSTTQQTIDASGLSIRWSVESMPASKDGGTAWGQNPSTAPTGITWDSVTMKVANTVTATNIYIAAFKSSGTLVDRETIPVIKDGEYGVSYSIVFTEAYARVNENGVVSAKLAGYAYKYVGGTRSAAVGQIRYGYIMTDPDYYQTDNLGNDGSFDSGQWFNGDDITEDGGDSPSIFAAIIISGSVVCVETVTISIKGSTGARGKVGRFYYYGGEFVATNNTTTFIVSDAQAPYFSHGINSTTGLMNCHVYNPTTNGTFTMKQMWDNSNQSWNNAPWEVMTNDFKYLITQAVFGEYAHFGSFIINEDWMISNNGTINGVSSNEYKKFYPEFVLGGSLCNQYNVTSTSYVNVGSAYFVEGTEYEIKVSGTDFSSSAQITVKITGSSSTKTLTSVSSQNTLTFEPSSSDTYYLQAKINTSGQSAKLTAYVDCFVPNYAVDGKTGKTYQNMAYVKGQIVATSGSIDSITATNLNIKSATITGDVTIGYTGVNIKLKPTGSGASVGASIVAYDGSETPFALTFDRFTYDGDYHPHAKLKLESIAPYNSKRGNIEITDTQTKRTLYYGTISSYAGYTLYEGYESITNFSGFVSKWSINNQFNLRIGISSTGVSCIIADALPVASELSQLPNGCIYRDGVNLKVKV